MNTKSRNLTKLLNRAFVYAVLGLAAGVFYREFTKFNGFTGRTALAFMHPHLLTLGALLMLLVVLFANSFSLTGEKYFGRFLLLHSIGMAMTVLLMLARGVLQVLATPLTKGMDAAISGVAGLGHILLGLASGIAAQFIAIKGFDFLFPGTEAGCRSGTGIIPRFPANTHSTEASNPKAE